MLYTLCVESFGPVWCENALVHAHEVRGVAIVLRPVYVAFKLLPCPLPFLSTDMSGTVVSNDTHRPT